MKVSPIFVLVFLSLTAGCVFPGGQDSYSTQLSLQNTDNNVRVFDIYVVNDSATIHLERSDGLTTNTNITEGIGVVDPGDGFHYTAVEPPESASKRGTFVVGSGNTTRKSINNMTESSVVIVVLSNDSGEILSWVSANCGDAQLKALEVTSIQNTSSVTHSCS